MFHYWNEAYRGAERGDIPADYWNEAKAILVDFIHFPGVQEYWELRKHWYSRELQALVDKMILEITPGSNPVYPDTLT